jgi:HTH-type transcriptional regulator/antitoxin HigA
MIGQINRGYEVLSRKRPLTLQMIRRLHRDLGIPAESLIKELPRKAA